MIVLELLLVVAAAAGGLGAIVRRRLRVSIARDLASDVPGDRREAILRPLEVEPHATVFLPYAHRESDPELLELLALRVHSSRWGFTTSTTRLGLRLWACRFSPDHFTLGPGQSRLAAPAAPMVKLPTPSSEREGGHR